jgi:hypothetical protein
MVSPNHNSESNPNLTMSLPNDWPLKSDSPINLKTSPPTHKCFRWNYLARVTKICLLTLETEKKVVNSRTVCCFTWPIPWLSVWGSDQGCIIPSAILSSWLHLFFYGGTYLLWGLCMERALCNPSGTQSFEMGPRFLENVCTPLLDYTEHFWSMDLCTSIAFVFEF